jgi:hypothetical protein
MARGSLAAKYEKSSYFARELACIRHALRTLPLLTQRLASAPSISEQAHCEMKKLTVPTAAQRLLHGEFSSCGASKYYFPALKWPMMPGLAIIRNAGVNLRSLNVAHFRTQGQMLGSEATKRLQRERRHDGPESCPFCKGQVSDDTTHALWPCRDAAMTRVRNKHFEIPHRHASQHAPKWARCWASAANDTQRTMMILQAANIAPIASKSSEAAIVADWLGDIMHQHATYAAHIRADHRSVFSYY